MAAIGNMHRGYPTETLARFLKARDGNVVKAHKMLIDCLQWRVENEIDNILATFAKFSTCGNVWFHKGGIFALDRSLIIVGVGLSTFDQVFDKYYVQSHIQMNEYRDRVIMPTATKNHGRYIDTCVKVMDMTGLKLSALNQLKLLTAITTIDDLNYPEKTDAYYIVNVPYVFSACWKVVKPLLQERTRKKVHVLKGCGMEELLKICCNCEGFNILNHVFKTCEQVMDYASLPHFCRKEDSRVPRQHTAGNTENCFSFDHVFHKELYNYIKQKAILIESISQDSFHVDLPEPDPDDAKIAKTIETEFHKLESQNGLTN
ncbi:unnamed protein product [Sphenostylis stenocarpa]|uniref:CRAL-TRIO domain-containing protein n=1 Tax=Sphenostylis stenocarpa TaxID=92480 RepID=A0AA86T4I2_9FABA|nr:unnamed protein product [Sphenostylis stenocarpa]